MYSINILYLVSTEVNGQTENEAQKKCLADFRRDGSENKCPVARDFAKCYLNATFPKRPSNDEFKIFIHNLTSYTNIRSCNLNLETLPDEVYNGRYFDNFPYIVLQMFKGWINFNDNSD